MDAAAGQGRVLEGMLVLELGARIGASVAGALLAQLGATVIFVEGAMRAEFSQPKWLFREQFGAGKLSLAADPADPADIRLMRELAMRSAVLLLSSDVDASAWDGLAQDLAHHPVVCDLTACGTGGPLQQPYCDTEIQALSGVLDATGLAGRPPTPVTLPLMEQLAGIYAAGAVLCALRYQRIYGVGQAIEISLYDVAFSAMTSFHAPILAGVPDDGITRVGNQHSMAAPWNVYRASDGWVLLCSGNDDQWRRICGLIGRQEIGLEPRFASNTERVKRRDEVDALVQAWVQHHDIAQCVREFGALGIPCGPVAPIDAFPREANLAHRQMVRETTDMADGRGIKVPGSPFKMDGSPGQALLRLPPRDGDRARLEAMAGAAPNGRPLPGNGTGDAAVQAAPLQALAGLRVVEIGHYTTAPLAARHLANLGAEVIKVEPPQGDAVRSWPPTRNGQGVFFSYQNTDKQSVVLDLDSEQGRVTLTQLLATADVLVENLRPGALAKRGFSPEQLRRAHPRLVYCAISGFGADTVYKGRPAFDTVIQAMSGLMDVNRVDGMPLKTGPSLADVMGAAFGLVAMLAALEYRDRTGQGQFVDLSMQDICAWATQTAWNRQQTPPWGWTIVPCSDGFVLADGTAAGTARVLTGLAAQGTLPREALLRELAHAHVKATPIMTLRETVAAPQTRARGLWFTVQEGGASFPLLASPLRLQRTPATVRRPAPPLGRDTEHVLKGLP